MKICFLCYRGNMYCGGQGVYLYYLTRELADRGHEITTIVGPPYPEDMPWARVIREVNHRFWGWHKDWLPKPNPFDAFQPINLAELIYRKCGFLPEPMGFSFRSLKTIFRLLQNGERFDLIHDVQSLGYGTLPIKLLGIPLVSTIHHPLTVDLRASMNAPGKTFEDVMGSIEFYPVLMQSIMSRCMDMILTGTQAGKHELETDFHIRPDRIRIVSNGLALEKFKKTERSERDPNKLLFVGYADGPQKGFYYLVEALKLLPPNIKLVAVDDEPNPMWSRWPKYRDGVRDRVIFTGKISDEELIMHYSTAAVTVVPSLYEGFGLPALEAILCGCPVVATNAGALPEIVEDGVTGILVEPKNPQALADGISHMMHHREAAEKMVVAGEKRIRENYSWEAVAARTEAAYRELLELKGKTKHAHS